MFSRDTACLVQTCVRQTSMMSSCHAGVPTHHPDLLLTFWTLSYMTDSHPHDIECPLCFCRIFLHVYVLIKHCVENFHCCDTQIVIIVGGTKGPERGAKTMIGDVAVRRRVYPLIDKLDCAFIGVVAWWNSSEWRCGKFCDTSCLPLDYDRGNNFQLVILTGLNMK